jgi:hypothetical protein
MVQLPAGGARFADVTTVRRVLLVALAGAALLGSISTWLVAADYPALPLKGAPVPHVPHTLTLTGPDAAARRNEIMRRAVFAPGEPEGYGDALAPPGDPLNGAVPSCRFRPEPPSGTTPKFDCVFDNGDLVKVKYGHDPEIHAEVAATRLLRMLGYPSDFVTIIPRLRCYGCPRHPFVVMHLRHTLHLAFIPDEARAGYTDFEWVAVERKFPAPAIQTDSIEGWEWRELAASAAPRADIDALRLTAAFLAHWDNKGSNQRLVCLDDPPPAAADACARPVAMIQDVGASFGPMKMNLARWRDLPIWYDRASCLVSMRALPFEGATFEDAYISEEGRQLMAQRLSAIADADIERVFADARFPQYQAGTDDQRDLLAWTAAFKHRARQIIDARCPDGNGPRTPARTESRR